MTDEKVRLRFSGLVIFLSQMASLLTGLVFVIIITRNLTTTEFGAWTNISQIVSTLTIAAAIFPFWSARYAARKFQGAMKLGLLANLGLSIPAAIIAIAAGPLFASASQTSSLNYIYAGILIIQSYVIAALSSVLAVKKPHIMGYALMIYESAKLAAAIPFILILGLSILGALTALLIANLAQISAYALVLRGSWFEKSTLTNLYEWVKSSPFNIYLAGATILSTFNVYLLLFAGGPLALAFYGAALAIAAPVIYSGSLTSALYPRLLVGGSSKDVESVWRISLMFSIPLTLAVVFLAPSLLSVLKAAYVPATMVVYLLVGSSLISTFGGLFDRIILGTERLDSAGTIALRDVFKSRMSKAIMASYVLYALSLPLLWLLLGRISQNAVTASELTALVALLLNSILVAVKWRLARGCMTFRFPTFSALKYTLIGLALLSVVPFLVQPLRAYVTILLFLGGAGLYFLVLYLLDAETRILFREALSLLQSRWPFVSP